MDRLALIRDFYNKVTEELGSAVSEVSEDAFHLMGAIAEGIETEIYVDGELYDFMSCTFEQDDPIWEVVNVVEEED